MTTNQINAHIAAEAAEATEDAANEYYLKLVASKAAPEVQRQARLSFYAATRARIAAHAALA